MQNTTDFNEIIELILNKTQQEFMQEKGITPKILINGTKNNVLIPMPFLPSNPEAKFQMFNEIGKELAKDIFKIGIINSVFFISEAWLGTAKKGDKLIRPSLDKNRKEVILINALELNMTTGNKNIVITYEIDRKQKEPKLKKDLDSRDSKDMSGFESNLINELMRGFATEIKDEMTSGELKKKMDKEYGKDNPFTAPIKSEVKKIIN